MLGPLCYEISWERKGLLGLWDHFLGGVGIVRSGETECPGWYWGSGQKGGCLIWGVEEVAVPVAALVLGDHKQTGAWETREAKRL